MSIIGYHSKGGYVQLENLWNGTLHVIKCVVLYIAKSTLFSLFHGIQAAVNIYVRHGDNTTYSYSGGTGFLSYSRFVNVT